jgi:hypothetical protein
MRVGLVPIRISISRVHEFEGYEKNVNCNSVFYRQLE